MKKFGSAVILAGGRSTRMGFDKQLIKCSKGTLIDKLTGKLGLIFDDVIIVSNRPEYYERLEYRVVGDIFKERGPMGGIHAGLKSSFSEYAYFIACDMPCINEDYIYYMKERIIKEQSDICVTKAGNRTEPFNAFYSGKILQALEENLKSDDRSSIYYFLQKQNCTYIKEEEARKFSPDLNMFLNLNTREDLLLFNRSVEA